MPAVDPSCPLYVGPQNRFDMTIAAGLNNFIVPNICKPRILASHIFNLRSGSIFFMGIIIVGG